MTRHHCVANKLQVAGEIRPSGEGATPIRTLKLGALLSVSLVTVLYILVTVAYVSPAMQSPSSR